MAGIPILLKDIIMVKRDKHWYASAIAFAESKTEKEFLAIRSFYYTHYTLNELKNKYEEM